MPRVALVLLVSVAVVAGAGVRLPDADLRASQQSPPVTYVCPMAEHADVLEDKPGKCPRCEMALEPVIIDLAWSCPVHPVVITERAGRCPLDRRELVQVAISRYWTCQDKPREHLVSPGRCADGRARTMVRAHRAHGDHNPKYGGQLFMASDKWHHIEAVYPRPGVLQVFVYDNFTKPMSVREFSGRAVTREEFDAASGKSRDVEAFPLRRARDGTSFEARIGNRQLPARVTVKLKFGKDGPDERFDFAFDAFSKAPAAPPSVAPQQAPEISGAAVARPSMNAVLAPFDPTQMAEPLPSDPAKLLNLLTVHEQEIGKLLEDGQLGAIYVPAMLAKEVALALEEHTRGLPERRRLEAMAAIKMVVLKAWELDAYGDIGDARKLVQARAAFAAAVKNLQDAYGPQ